MKLLITGGHLSPALALIEELQKAKKGIDIVFISRTSEKADKKVNENNAVFLNLHSVIERMNKTYGVTSVLLEAGKTVLTSFLKAGLIDKFIFFIALLKKSKEE